MNSYTHSGFMQSVRRLKSETIEPNYEPEEILEVLGFANSIGMLSAIHIAIMAGNEKLAMEILEKSKTELAKPFNA